MKKMIFLPVLMVALFLPLVSHANFSSIRNIHTTIYNQKGVTVPVESGVVDTDLGSSRYLMKQIDRANESLNGYASTDYTNSTRAVNNPVYVSKVLTDVDELIVALPSFELTVSNVNAFSFQMSAAGNFRVQWGDGLQDVLSRTGNTTETTYSHSYAAIGTYTVKIMGLANGYNSSETISTIRFSNSTNRASITAISGSLSTIFVNVGGVNPRFRQTFQSCTGLTSIPSGLFAGLSGQPSTYMFFSTFYLCVGINSEIPVGLFSGLSGTPVDYMFFGTFNGCSSLYGSIPAGLFGNIYGAPATSMFGATFYGCGNLSGSIPGGLFGNLYGPPAYAMFSSTFYNCIGLDGAIPTGLFGALTDAPAAHMFNSTFYNCVGLDDISGGFENCTFTVGTAPASLTFTFYGCNSAASASPVDSVGTKFYDWDNTTTSLGTFTYDIDLTDYATIPATRK